MTTLVGWAVSAIARLACGIGTTFSVRPAVDRFDWKIRPLLRVGRFSVAKFPEDELDLMTAKASPLIGVKPFPERDVEGPGEIHWARHV